MSKWILLLLVGLVGYGVFIEPARLEITQHIVGAESDQTGIRIVQISDLHLRAMNEFQHQVARHAVESRPDIIVFTGDIVDRKESLPALESFLNELGNIPKVAIVGNWEYWSDIDFKKLADVYARHQGRLLVNDCQFAKVGKLHLALVGLDDALAGVPDILHALKQCPQADARILIEHTPEFFGKPLDSVAGNAPYLLSLSGHTHGGQIALFGFSLQIPPGSGAYNRGWYDTKLGRMYVSRGIGTSVIPIRIGATPELPLFIVNLQQ